MKKFHLEDNSEKIDIETLLKEKWIGIDLGGQHRICLIDILENKAIVCYVSPYIDAFLMSTDAPVRDKKELVKEYKNQKFYIFDTYEELHSWGYNAYGYHRGNKEE